MTSYWRYLDDTGAPRGRSEPLHDRAAAEAWLSEEWPSLVDDGVAAVALIDGDDEVYRMPLGEPG